MKKITINHVNEDIYFEKLDNGLDVYLYVNKNMHNNYVTFTTKYGSVNNEFGLGKDGKFYKVPNGIAHFLEHKLFTKEDGSDVMEDFSKLGCSSNAYTTDIRTRCAFCCNK